MRCVLSTLLWAVFSISAGEFEVMSYNVENLFDYQKDKNKDDWTYLPRGTPGKKLRCQKIRSHFYRQQCLRVNWTKESLEIKLNQIKKVINAKSKKPDILAIIEVENENVLKELAKKLDYKKWIITNGPDRRGVDVAIMLNEKNNTIRVVEKNEVEIKGGAPTRNILEVVLRISDKYTFVLYVNHWPSLRAPTKARIRAAKTLKQMMDFRLKKDPKSYLMAVGDFNTVLEDDPHPLNSILLKDNFLCDVQSIAPRKGRTPGTYFYAPKMKWNHLDRILISRNLKRKGGLYADYLSYEIFGPRFITRSYQYDGKKHGYLSGSVVSGVPYRYNFRAQSDLEAGFSDHFPISIKVYY